MYRIPFYGRYLGPVGVSKPLMLKPEDFENAPSGPGIYAWYLDTRAYPTYLARNDPGSFIADLNRRHALIDPATKIVLKSSENFGLFWSADVQLRTIYSSQHLRELAFDDAELRPPSQWLTEDDGSEVDSTTTPDESQAEILAQTLIDVFPFFSSPLYIGTSNNLQTRLIEHRRLLERLYLTERRHQKNLAVDKVWKQFAHRCFGQRLRLDDLVVFVAELGAPVAPGNDETFKRARELAERFLNLISRPIFGMR